MSARVSPNYRQAAYCFSSPFGLNLIKKKVYINCNRSKSSIICLRYIFKKQKYIIQCLVYVYEKYLVEINPVKLEIKDTTESNTSTSYLDLLLSIGRDGQLHTSIYEKRDNLYFHITNVPFLSSYIPAAMASLSHSLYDMHRLAPRMKVLF